jgi:hypothetical protein
MQCAFCSRPLEAKSAWKGASEQFYCGEFCAEAESPEPVRDSAPSTLLQQHTYRPYERLERMLPYMRQYSQARDATARPKRAA